MIRFNRRLICCLVFFSSLICVLLAWPGLPVNAATKVPVLPGFVAVALYPDLTEDLGLPREQQGFGGDGC